MSIVDISNLIYGGILMKKNSFFTILILICILCSSSFSNAVGIKSTLVVKEPKIYQDISNLMRVVTPKSADMGVVNTDGVRVRSSAGTSGTVRGLLYEGDEVEISDSMGRVYKDGLWWIYVLTVNPARSNGWVAEQYITYYDN